MNKKGFIATEALMVSVVVLVSLVLVYVQFARINRAYSNAYSYNTVNGIYALNQISSYFYEENTSKLIEDLTTYIDITSCSTKYFKNSEYCKMVIDATNIEYLLFTYNDKDSINVSLRDNTYDLKLINFIKTINTNDSNHPYVLIAKFKDNSYASIPFATGEPDGLGISSICQNIVLEEDAILKARKVEDLVCLSKLVSEGNTFENKTITLMNDIDFNDDKSYKNPNKISEVDINENGINESIKKEVTTGMGFIPIGSDSNEFKGTFKSLNLNTISNLYINRTSDYVGLFGYLGSNGNVGEFNLTNSTVKGGHYTAGVVGYNNGGTIYAMNIEGLNVEGKGNTGGVVGYHVSGTIREVVVRGNITGTGSAGGIAGYTGGSKVGYIYNALTNSVVSGADCVGGMVGHNSNNKSIVCGVVEGESITATAGSGGKAIGCGDQSPTITYTSNSITISRTSTQYRHDGTSYSSDNINNLLYYGNIKYNTSQPLLESVHTGDVNESGYWFSNKINGDIYVTKVETDDIGE